MEQGFGKTGPLWFNLAQVAGLALGMVFRFTTYKWFVFLSPERRRRSRFNRPAHGRALRRRGRGCRPAVSRES